MELHPEGTFNDVEILDHGFDESPDKGTLNFWVKFKTEHGEIGGRFYMSEKAIEHTCKKIAAMGFRGDDLNELAGGETLLGKLCQITVEHEEYDGTTRARVGFVNENHSTGNWSHNEAAALKASQFNAIWRAQKGNAASSDTVPF